MTKIRNLLEVENFIEFIVAQKNLSKNTCLSYNTDLLQFIKFIDNRLLVDVTENDINRFVVNLSKKFSGSTHSRKLSTLKQFYSFLHYEKKCIKDPTLNIDFPKNDKKLPKVLSEEEMSKLIEILYQDKSFKGIRLKTMVEIMYATGIRVTELVSLKISSFQNNFSSLIVMGKGNKERFVPLTSQAKIAVKEYLQIRKIFLNEQVNDEGFLFPSNSKNRFLSRNRFFQILKELSIKVNINPDRMSPHVIRHSFATHLLDRGVDLRIIQTSLGHSDISSTQIYTHVHSNKLKNIIENKHPLKVNLNKLAKL